MCPHCRAFISSSDRTCPYCDTEVGPKAIDLRRAGDAMAGFIPHARFTTILILTINFGLYAATALYSMKSGHEALMDIDGRTLFQFGAKYRQAILLGQWWRLITAGFLHGGIFHILMNSWVLFDLGAQVEEIYGSKRMVVIYFISTIFGFMASTWWSPALSIGASAGIFGLIGAMIALGVRSNTAMGSMIRGMYIRWAVYGLLMGLLPFFQVDNAAHIGGLAGGFVVAYFAGLPGDRGKWMETFWSVALGLSVAITAFAFVQMAAWFTLTSR
jgi:rhomboid protease GluP